MQRRTLTLFLAALGLLLPWPAGAQDYPVRPITIVVPLAPGGLADTMTRYIADRLQKSIGAAVIVDNRPGHTSIGGAVVARAKPDGYTLLLVNAAYVINQLKLPPPPFDLAADFTAVAHVVDVPSIVAVHPSFPAKTFAEFIDYVHAHPGEASYASSGAGSTGNLIGEAIKQRARLELVHVPYRGSSPAIVATVAGETKVVIDGGLEQLTPLIRAGRLRPLAITSSARVPAFPDVPAVREQYPAFGTMNSWIGFVAPQGVSPDIARRLNKEINAIAATPEFAEKFLKNGSVLALGSAPEFQGFIASEVVRIDGLVKGTGMRLSD